MTNVTKAFTLEQAAKLGQISTRQASYWAHEGILVPSILYDRKRRPIRYLYSFADVVGLRTIGMLRNKYHVSLQSIRKAANVLQGHANRPWSELRLWIRGKELFFQDPETLNIVSATPSKQRTIEIEIQPIATTVEREAQKLWQRKPDDIGKTEQRRNVLHNQPVVKGTRVPVSSLVSLAKDGYDADEIVRAYPSLTRDDVQAILGAA